MNKRKELEKRKRDIIKNDKPYVYQKMLKLNQKLENGQSIAIIQFQYNYICNFKCQHCSVKRFQGQSNKRKFTIDDVKKLSKQADQMGLARFVITGGQPLIFKDFDELIQALDPSKFYINVDTNGWYLDDNKAKHLKQIGVDRIQLSIDSLNEQQHDKFRRTPGSFKRTMKAIDASLNAGLDIFIQTVVTHTRLYSQQFIDFVQYFNNRDIGVFVSYAKPVGAWQGYYKQLVNKEDMNYFRQLQKKYNLFTHLTPAYGRDLGCIAVKGMISITEYGDVMPCPYIHVSLGNIFKQSLRDIIQRGLNIKQFGEWQSTCLIAEDINFIKKYIQGRTYNKPLPVQYQQVFDDNNKTQKPFNEYMKQTGKFSI